MVRGSGEALLIGPHKGALADCRAGLQVAQVGRPARQFELADTGADRAGANERDLPARLPEALDLIGQFLQARRLQPAVRPGEHVRADLDDDRMGQGDHFLADRINHARQAGPSNECRPSRDKKCGRACRDAPSSLLPRCSRA